MANLTTDDVRLCDVMGVKEARVRLGLTTDQMRWRVKRGVIKRIILPNGVAAVLRESVEAYAAQHERGQ